MTRLASFRRLAHAASACILLVCAVQVWTTFFLRSADSIARSLILEWALLPAGVLFIAWLNRARRNLMEFKGEERAYGPGWTIGAWIIPIVNLIMPALVTADVVKGSTTDDTTRRKLLALVWIWWPCYLGNTVAAFARDAEDPFHPALLIGTASYLAAGVLVVVLMYKVIAAQCERFAAVSEPDPADFPAFTMDDVKAAEAA